MNHKILLPLSILLLAACSKNDADLSSDFPIEFSPNALQTKALILPGTTAPAQNAFPTTESFNVFAFADLDGTGTNYETDYAKPLMNDVNISYQGESWKATSGTYLWPATGTVDFYAYHPSSLSTDFVQETPYGLSFTGVNVGDAIGTQIDPLVARSVAQVSSAKPVVPLVFRHITSQFAAKAFDATVTDALKGKIFIEKVEFKNMNTVGDYRDAESSGSGSWSNQGTPGNFILFEGSQRLAEEASYVAGDRFSDAVTNSSAFVAIPGIVSDSDDAAGILVTYSINSYTLNGFVYPATESRTVRIPLYGRVSDNRLKNGRRYVFNIGISLDGAKNEILFAPTVDGWETESIDGITVDAFNGELL